MFVWYAQRGYSRRAIHYGQRAISFYESEKQSSRWEIEFLHWGILACYWERSHLSELHELTRRYRENARDRSDPMSLFWMHVNATITSDLSLDQIEAARAATEIASQAIADQRFQSPRFFLWLSRSSRYLCGQLENRPTGIEGRLEESIRFLSTGDKSLSVARPDG